MAKNINPIIRLQGNFKNMVFVNSSTYGDHVRALRGSVNNASLNETLQKHADRTIHLNNAAKRVHDLLKAYAGNFKESLLWQQMLSRLRKTVSNDFPELLLCLQGLELNHKYPLQRFGKIPTPGIDIKKQKMMLSLPYFSSPVFKRTVDCYYYEACILCFGSKKENDRYVTARTEWIKAGDKAREWSFEFDLPARMKYYLVCLKLAGGNNEIEKADKASMGIAVVSVGKIGSSCLKKV